jgi:parallel beta-helix repeat protein
VFFVAVSSYALTDVIIIICPDPPGGESPPSTLYVDDDSNCGGNSPCYTTIQAAVDDASAQCSEADTVYVYAGNYLEHVTIGKSLTLKGEDRDTTVIDGGGSENVIYINANNVTVTGFKITNGYYGIYTTNASNSSNIQDCEILGNQVGLRANWASYTVVSDNEVHGNVTRGIHLDSMTNSYVENNKVYSNGQGISVGYMAHSNTIRNNVVRDNTLGINFGAEANLPPNYAYHNDLINNDTQSNTSNNSNEWDDGSIGNYWSDYTGVDDDGDGIGDTPYTIKSDSCCSYDNYPHMSPLNIFEIRETIPIPPEHSGARVHYAGDLDYDGNLDIVYTWGDPYSTFVIERDENTFVNRFTSAGYGTTVAEVDGDNYPEILATVGTTSAKIFEATGDNTYAQRHAMSFPNKIEPSPHAGDSDGDGKREFLVPAEWVGVRIYEADSNDSYTLETTLIRSGNGNIRSVGVYDLDGDGHPETVFNQNPYNNYQNTLYVFEEDNGTRTEVYSLAVGQYNCQSLGDLDGNGLGEIIGLTSYSKELRIYESQGNNNDFQIVYQYQNFCDDLGVCLYRYDDPMDFDKDGQSELWRPIDTGSGQLDAFTLAHRNGGTIVDFYNSGELLQSFSGEVRGLLAIGDTNGDGRLEIAVVKGDQIHILEHTNFADTDGDSIPDSEDNCWYVSNPDQLDTNGVCPTPPYNVDPECGDACAVEGLLFVDNFESYTEDEVPPSPWWSYAYDGGCFNDKFVRLFDGNQVLSLSSEYWASLAGLSNDQNLELLDYAVEADVYIMNRQSCGAGTTAGAGLYLRSTYNIPPHLRGGYREYGLTHIQTIKCG